MVRMSLLNAMLRLLDVEFLQELDDVVNRIKGFRSGLGVGDLDLVSGFQKSFQRNHGKGIDDAARDQRRVEADFAVIVFFQILFFT